MTDDEENIFKQVIQASGAGVDPDLLPYLKALEEDDIENIDFSKLPPFKKTETEVREEIMEVLTKVAYEYAGGNEPANDGLNYGNDYLKYGREEVNEDNLLYDTGIDPVNQPGAADIVSSKAIAEDAKKAKERAEAAIERRFEQIVDELFQMRPEHEIDPTTERVQNALHWLGDPQLSYPVIHVGGTNGKTSTARLIDSLLTAQGLRVGRFTSPHLVDMCERITLSGTPLTHEEFVACYDDCMPVIELAQQQNEARGLGRMSFFEILTVLAFQAFAFAPVDVVVLEVGMGGRWDSTNVVNTAVQVLTPIAMDHQEYLGDTLIDIAREKTGIIKPGASVICAKQTPAVNELVREVCLKQKANRLVIGEAVEILGAKTDETGQSFNLRTPAATYTGLHVNLHGAHQLENAALAVAAVEAFNSGKALGGEVVEEGLEKATSPGRLELLKRSPQILVDAAHNPHGAAALRKALDHEYAFEHLVGVFSAMEDKDYETVLGELEPVINELVIVQIPTARGADLDKLQKIADEVFGSHRVHAAESVGEAMETAAALSDAADSQSASKGILAFGSVMLVGLVKQALTL